MAISSFAKISAKLEIVSPQGLAKSVVLSEGDFIDSLVYTEGGAEKTLSGIVRVINTTNLNTKVSHSCPPEPYTYRTVKIDSLVIDWSEKCDSNITTVPISSILDFKSVTSDYEKKPVDATAGSAGIANAIDTAEEGQVVSLAAGSYTGTLAINKGCEIVGPNNLSQNPGAVVDDETKMAVSGAVIADAITVNAPDQKVAIKGMSINKNCMINIEAAKEVTFENCRFIDIVNSGTEIPVMIKGNQDVPTKINLVGNFFGTANKDGEKICKNVVEVYAFAKDGSCFKDNYIATDACRNNSFCFYNVDEGATITVANNFVEKSHNMIRVGTKGDAHFTLNVENNTILSTDESEDGAWAGILIFQPYGKETTSFGGVTVNFNRNQYPENQPIFYLYCGSGDLQLNTDELLPTVYVNNKLVDKADYKITLS